MTGDIDPRHAVINPAAPAMDGPFESIADTMASVAAATMLVGAVVTVAWTLVG